MGTVAVTSRLTHPVAMRVDEMVDSADHGQAAYSPNVPGLPTARQKGESVILKPGRNEVDTDFWQAWKAQHEAGDLFKLLDVEKTK